MNPPVIFVSHAATAHNGAVDLVTGWADPPLTAEGRAQALRLAVTLQGKGLTRVVSSDLRRAKETALIVARHLGVRDVRSTAALRPWKLGALQGKRSDEAEPIWRRFAVADPERPVPGGGESFDRFKGRNLAEFRRILNSAMRNPGILVVGHSRTLDLLAAWLARGASGESIDLRRYIQDGTGTAEVMPLQHGPDGWREMRTK